MNIVPEEGIRSDAGHVDGVELKAGESLEKQIVGGFLRWQIRSITEYSGSSYRQVGHPEAGEAAGESTVRKLESDSAGHRSIAFEQVGAQAGALLFCTAAAAY